MHLELADANQKLYVCPGETIPISHAVHLGRLAQCYPACQACPLNCETGAAEMPVVERLKQKQARQLAEMQRSLGRIRGVYLNQIDRRVAGDIVGQFAANLWNDTQRAVRTHRREKVDAWTAPVVVIGYDQRTSSPDIVTGVQDRLRLMGCAVIDLGLTTGPALQYAIRFHSATSGVFVSGSGHSPAWTGLDFFDATALPADIEHLQVPRAGDTPIQHARPVRWSGQHTFKPIASDYALRLGRYVRLRRPLTVCVGVEDQVARDLVEAVFEPLGDRLQIVKLPKRPRNLSDPDDADTIAIGQAVLEQKADVGFVIDEDMRHCVLIDNFGDPAFPKEIASILDGDVQFFLEDVEGLWPMLKTARRTSGPHILCDRSIYAFPKQSIACDAVLTLAHLLTRLSQQGLSLADIVADHYRPTNQ